MMHFPKKKSPIDGREYGEERASGSFSAEDIARATALMEEIGTQKSKGFVFIVKRNIIEEDDDHQDTEVDGMVKVSGTNKKFMLDAIFHALNMSNKDIIEYVTMRTVVGSEFDGGTHSHD